MKQKIFFTIALLVMTTGMARTEELTQYVDPLIGSAEHGHVFVGANVPFGFVQLGPSSIPQEWDWCSGYNRSDSTVIGFAHTHLSGTGCGDLHDITLRFRGSSNQRIIDLNETRKQGEVSLWVDTPEFATHEWDF